MVQVFGARALARISIVDCSLHVLLDLHVAIPHEHVTDYATEVSGVERAHLDPVNGALPFDVVQARVAALLAGTHLVVGHALENDFAVLKLEPPPPARLRDTAWCKLLCPARPRALRVLAAERLCETNFQRPGVAHSSIQDACVAFRVYKSVRERYERARSGGGLPFLLGICHRLHHAAFCETHADADDCACNSVLLFFNRWERMARADKMASMPRDRQQSLLFQTPDHHLPISDHAAVKSADEPTALATASARFALDTAPALPRAAEEQLHSASQGSAVLVASSSSALTPTPTPSSSSSSSSSSLLIGREPDTGGAWIDLQKAVRRLRLADLLAPFDARPFSAARLPAEFASFAAYARALRPMLREVVRTAAFARLEEVAKGDDDGLSPWLEVAVDSARPRRSHGSHGSHGHHRQREYVLRTVRSVDAKRARASLLPCSLVLLVEAGERDALLAALRRILGGGGSDGGSGSGSGSSGASASSTGTATEDYSSRAGSGGGAHSSVPRHFFGILKFERKPKASGAAQLAQARNTAFEMYCEVSDDADADAGAAFEPLADAGVALECIVLTNFMTERRADQALTQIAERASDHGEEEEEDDDGDDHDGGRASASRRRRPTSGGALWLDEAQRQLLRPSLSSARDDLDADGGSRIGSRNGSSSNSSSAGSSSGLQSLPEFEVGVARFCAALRLNAPQSEAVLALLDVFAPRFLNLVQGPPGMRERNTRMACCPCAFLCVFCVRNHRVSDLKFAFDYHYGFCLLDLLRWTV